MNKQSWWWALGAVALFALALFVINLRNTSPEPGSETPPQAVVEEEEEAAGTVRGPSFRWAFAPAGENEAGVPLTRVTLSINGEERDLGTHQGSCSVVNDSMWTLADGELTGVICWFAGGGTEIGVFYDAGVYSVREGIVEEGTAELPGFRGNYETLFTL